MKNALLLLVVSAFVLSCSPQTTHEPVKEYRLQGKAAESWKQIKDDFYQNGFLPCLAKKKVAVSCAGCTGVILRGIIHIDKKGKYTGFTKTYDRYCGSPIPIDVESCFIQFFNSIEFPSGLRGISIEIDLGRALKC